MECSLWALPVSAMIDCCGLLAYTVDWINFDSSSLGAYYINNVSQCVAFLISEGPHGGSALGTVAQDDCNYVKIIRLPNKTVGYTDLLFSHAFFSHEQPYSSFFILFLN